MMGEELVDPYLVLFQLDDGSVVEHRFANVPDFAQLWDFAYQTYPEDRFTITSNGTVLTEENTADILASASKADEGFDLPDCSVLLQVTVDPCMEPAYNFEKFSGYRPYSGLAMIAAFASVFILCKITSSLSPVEPQPSWTHAEAEEADAVLAASFGTIQDLRQQLVVMSDELAVLRRKANASEESLVLQRNYAEQIQSSESRSREQLEASRAAEIAEKNVAISELKSLLERYGIAQERQYEEITRLRSSLVFAEQREAACNETVASIHSLSYGGVLGRVSALKPLPRAYFPSASNVRAISDMRPTAFSGFWPKSSRCGTIVRGAAIHYAFKEVYGMWPTHIVKIFTSTPEECEEQCNALERCAGWSHRHGNPFHANYNKCFLCTKAQVALYHARTGERHREEQHFTTGICPDKAHEDTWVATTEIPTATRCQQASEKKQTGPGWGLGEIVAWDTSAWDHSREGTERREAKASDSSRDSPPGADAHARAMDRFMKRQMAQDFGRDLSAKPLLLSSVRNDLAIIEDRQIVLRWPVDPPDNMDRDAEAWSLLARGYERPRGYARQESAVDDLDIHSDSTADSSSDSSESEAADYGNAIRVWQAELGAALGGLEVMNEIFLVEDSRAKRLLTRAEKMARKVAKKLNSDAEENATDDTRDQRKGADDAKAWNRGELLDPSTLLEVLQLHDSFVPDALVRSRS
jgi:hypothetical protein